MRCWIAARTTTTTTTIIGLLLMLLLFVLVHPQQQPCNMHVGFADAFTAVRVASPIVRRQVVAVRRISSGSSRSNNKNNKNIVGNKNFCCTSSTANKNNNQKTMYTIDCPPTDPEKLRRTVTKHVQKLDRYLESRSVAHHTAAAFAELARQLSLTSDQRGASSNNNDTRDIILDSGCGTGRSSLLLGRQFPECTVIGVDRSLARLSKRPRLFHAINNDSYDKDKDDDKDDETNDDDQQLVYRAASNVWLVRAELVDFWRLLLLMQQSNHATTKKYRVTRHYLLYPNPYPKPRRFKSRWYAHPSFPLLLRVASEATVVRSNWDLYLHEFAAAAECVMTEQQQVGGDICLDLDPIETIPPFSTTEALTNFEQKYWDVGEPTFELVLRRRSMT